MLGLVRGNLLVPNRIFVLTFAKLAKLTLGDSCYAAGAGYRAENLQVQIRAQIDLFGVERPSVFDLNLA